MPPKTTLGEILNDWYGSKFPGYGKKMCDSNFKRNYIQDYYNNKKVDYYGSYKNYSDELPDEPTNPEDANPKELERSLERRKAAVEREAERVKQETDALTKKEKQIEDRLKDLLKKEASIKVREDELHKRMEEIEAEVKRLKEAAAKIDAEVFKKSELYELLG